jgi:uncharacterized protein YcbK (DUF882 family)
MSKYFSDDELKCKCGCNQNNVDTHFMSLLDSLRAAVGQPLIINSGYRCPAYDKELGGEGNHPTGRAADIRCEDSKLRYQIVAAAMMLGFGRIGVARGFIHLDLVTGGGKPHPVLWLY